MSKTNKQINKEANKRNTLGIHVSWSEWMNTAHSSPQIQRWVKVISVQWAYRYCLNFFSSMIQKPGNILGKFYLLLCVFSYPRKIKWMKKTTFSCQTMQAYKKWTKDTTYNMYQAPHCLVHVVFVYCSSYTHCHGKTFCLGLFMYLFIMMLFN